MSSTLQIVDLAGSERLKKSKATGACKQEAVRSKRMMTPANQSAMQETLLIPTYVVDSSRFFFLLVF